MDGFGTPSPIGKLAPYPENLIMSYAEIVLAFNVSFHPTLCQRPSLGQWYSAMGTSLRMYRTVVSQVGSSPFNTMVSRDCTKMAKGIQTGKLRDDSLEGPWAWLQFWRIAH